MIKINNLNKYYNKGKENEIHVIHDVNLELPNTGLISFLGPSGSGKTTLLNVIGGLDKAKGSISYDEMTLENYRMRQVDAFRSKEIGYVFQNYNLLLEETVYSNLAIALEMVGIYDKEEQEKRIEYTLQAVGMFKYRKKRAYALSGGQQQRVSIARALVKQAKIIIADEPTGNLDSENTIEVMNILKKISKTSLVLVVTHNEDVANFYSDEVIKIKDGCIVDSYKNDGKQFLNTEQNNTIYLKDMQHLKLNDDQVTINVYTKNLSEDFSLDVMYMNGTFYLKSNQKIKLAEESNVKVLDKHYESLKLETVDKHEYDASWFSAPIKRKNPFKSFAQSFMQSFNKIRFSKRKTKFLYFAFFLIGMLLAACVVGYSNFITIDDAEFIVDPEYSQVYSDDYMDWSTQSDFTFQNFKTGALDSAECPVHAYIHLSRKLNINETMESLYEIHFLSTNSKKLDLVRGKTPKSGEIVIGRQLADQILKENSYFYSSYDSLIGEKVDISLNVLAGKRPHFPIELRISGISSTTTKMAYLYDEDYMSYYRINELTSATGALPVMRWRQWLIDAEYQTYTVVEGRDLNGLDQLTHNILMPVNYPNAQQYLNGKELVEYLKMTDGSWLPSGNVYNVVGLFEVNNFETRSDEFVGYWSSQEEYNTFTKSNEIYQYNNYEIVEGVDAKRYDECVVSIYSAYSVGDVLNNRIKVVGKYIGGYEVISYGVLYHRDYVVSMNQENCWFKVKDMKKIQYPSAASTIAPKIKILNTYDYISEPLLAKHKTQQLVFGLASIGTVIVLAIFIYLMMRSKMISEIASIGIYRCLGQSRLKIILQFVYDILITVTLTSFLGFLLSIGLFDLFVFNYQNTLLMSVANQANEFFGYAILALYGINLIFGLIPVYMLLRKTPAEIVSKYDI